MSTVHITTSEITSVEPVAAAARPTNVWSLALRIGLSGLLLGVLFSRMNIEELSSAIKTMRWDGWLLAAGLLLISQIASGLRWAGLARAVGFQHSRLEFLRLYFSGTFFSLCLPSSIGGDVLKAYWLASNIKGRLLAGCTVLADRLSGLAAIALIGSAAFLYANYELSTWQFVGLCVGLMSAFLIVSRLTMQLIKRLTSSLPTVNELTDNNPARPFVNRLLPYCHHPAVVWRAVAWSLLVQGLNVLSVAAIGYSLGLRVPFEAYAISVPLVALLTVVPVSLSGLGVREGGMAWMLAGYGVDETYGVAIGLLWFAATAATGLLGGVVYLVSKRPATS